MTGVQTCALQISIGATVLVVNVTLVVTAQASSAGREMSTVREAGCAPSKLALVSTGLPGNFSVPAAWPASLVIRMADDCGSLVSNGKVIVSFSNGDPPVTLISDRVTGTYSGTWNVGTVSSSMTVTATGTSTGLPAATTTLVGGVNVNPTPPPTIAQNGVLHNSDPRLGGALAPGNVVAVFGSGLASQTTSPGVIPLANSFNGTEVVVGGVDAPLYFLSPGQLNIQIPYELSPLSTYQIVAIVNNAVSNPQSIDLVAQVPGITSFADGRLIAQHADFTLVSASSPAKPGEILVMYLAGMGFTSTPVQIGRAHV